MKAKELVDRCVNIAKNYKTVYMWGCVGSPVTPTTIASRAAQYPDWYTPAKQSRFQTLVGKDYWGFDCVNLIKAVLWGWNGDRTKSYGGAQYASNGVPDVSANGAIQLCRNVTTNFRQEIPIGAALWCSGHIGLYIGDGLGVECTPAWKNGVQITAVKNIGTKAGYDARQWTKWGLLPWVDYSTEPEQKEQTKPGNKESGGKEMTKEELMDITGTGDAPSQWHKESTTWAKRKGLFKGTDSYPADYGWQVPMTREQFAEVLYRFAKMIGKA